MDKNQKKRLIQEWWEKTARLHLPEKHRRIEEEMRQGRSRLFTAFAGSADGAELTDTLRDLIANCYAYAHYEGVRRGYRIASQLFRSNSEKTENRAKAAIARLIERYPEWTTLQIFEALDEKENLPFYRLQNVPKNVTRWSDVAKEPTYKMFVSRIRETVRAKRRITGWKKLMRRHDELRAKLS